MFLANALTVLLLQAAHWDSVGYGYYLEIDGEKLEAYELTSISCLPKFTATTADGVQFQLADRPVTFSLLPGDSPESRRLHLNGTASDIVIRQRSARPATCDEPLADTPLTNFDRVRRSRSSPRERPEIPVTSIGYPPAVGHSDGGGRPRNGWWPPAHPDPRPRA